MGILSAVSIAAPAGILNALLGDDKNGFKERLWAAGPFFVLAGSVFCVIAALLFYRQRSRLAWYYGQMCLTESLDKNASKFDGLREYMQGIDSWAEWKSYSWGFDALFLGFTEYISAVLLVLSRQRGWLFETVRVIGAIAPLAALGYAALQWRVYNRYRFQDDLWGGLWLVRFFRRLGMWVAPFGDVDV